MFDYMFALFHLFLLIGIIVFAFYSLLQGNVLRFLILIVLLTGYYFLVLHKAVRQEIQRRKKKKT